MNILELITSKSFQDIDQFERRKQVKNFILTKKDCKIGTSIICFEKETIYSEKSRYFYKKYGKPKCNVTVGKEYKILDIKSDKIKIENDKGKKLWFSIDRFLYSIKIERKNKLLKLIENE